MCELLGISFNLPVNPKISFKGFQQRGECNPDGWGIAFYPDESAQIFKEPVEAAESSLANFIQEYSGIKSNIFIAHVRKTRNLAYSLSEKGFKPPVFSHS